MSRLPFEMMLALRYLQPKRTFVSVITLISVIGVTLAVAVLIVVISVMTGFDQQLRQRILGFNAHLRIEKRAPFPDYAEVMELVGSNRLVKGVAPYVIGQVMVQTQPAVGSSRVVFPAVRGIDPRVEAKVTVLMSSIVEGTNDVRGNRMLVGRDFARKLELEVGDRLEVFSLRDLRRVHDVMKRTKGQKLDEGYLPTEYEISGIFDVGYYEFNDLFIVTSLANAQDMYDLGDSVQGLMVMLEDPDESVRVRQELGPILGEGYYISTWQEENAGILDALLVEKNVMFYLLFFIMIVAAFGIMSALITFVVQKTREVGILKALGASSGQIMWIFFSQSLLVGIMGVIVGLGTGILAVSYRNEFLFFLRRVTNFQLFPAEIYNFTELPALVDPGDIVIICGGSLVICLLAGLFPAWYAGRMKPVDALRHE